MEHEEYRLLLIVTELLGDIGLVLAKELRVKLDVSWRVDAVYVAEAGGDGEVLGYRAESLLDSPDVLGLSIKGRVINTGVVDLAKG